MDVVGYYINRRFPMIKRRKIPRPIQLLLADHPHRFEIGGKHIKLFVYDRLAMVISLGTASEMCNVPGMEASIRRHIRQLGH